MNYDCLWEVCKYDVLVSARMIATCKSFYNFVMNSHYRRKEYKTTKKQYNKEHVDLIIGIQRTRILIGDAFQLELLCKLAGSGKEIWEVNEHLLIKYWDELKTIGERERAPPKLIRRMKTICLSHPVLFESYEDRRIREKQEDAIEQERIQQAKRLMIERHREMERIRDEERRVKQEEARRRNEEEIRAKREIERICREREAEMRRREAEERMRLLQEAEAKRQEIRRVHQETLSKLGNDEVSQALINMAVKYESALNSTECHRQYQNLFELGMITVNYISLYLGSIENIHIKSDEVKEIVGVLKLVRDNKLVTKETVKLVCLLWILTTII